MMVRQIVKNIIIFALSFIFLNKSVISEIIFDPLIPNEIKIEMSN